MEVRGDFSEGIVIRYEFEEELILHHTLDDTEKVAISCGPYVLALLSDKSEFFEVPFTDENIDNYLTCDEKYVYRWDDKVWIPLYQVEDQRYHVYLKQKKSGLEI